jgi:signal transduction histidine kinase
LLQLPWKMFSPDGEPRTRESHPALVALRERRAVTDDRMLVLRGEALKDRAPGDAPAPGRLWLEVQAMLLDPADPASPVISAFRDVTADVQARRLQDELLGIVAHELRAPLTSLRGALAMLAGTTREADGPAGTLLPMALRNVERLEALVTDLLDLERIEAGQLPMTLEDVPVQALLDDVTDVHGLVAARDGLTLACPASSLRVRGDAARLQQVVRNLVGNALKFSPPGSTVTVDAVDGPSDTVVLRVTDQGRGIPEDQRERIFERFAQVKREDATRKGGAGLGLSIVRAIVEAHGGRVHIEDGPGGGSRFVVRLPRAE